LAGHSGLATPDLGGRVELHSSGCDICVGNHALSKTIAAYRRIKEHLTIAQTACRLMRSSLAGKSASRGTPAAIYDPTVPRPYTAITAGPLHFAWRRRNSIISSLMTNPCDQWSGQDLFLFSASTRHAYMQQRQSVRSPACHT